MSPTQVLPDERRASPGPAITLPDDERGPSARALVLHDAALADGTSERLRTSVSLRFEDGVIAWIRPAADADLSGAEVVDAGGAVIVPAMVDSHSHLTLQGGSHWIARGDDDAGTLRATARDNAKRLVHAGVLWVRDVGAPMRDGAPLPSRSARSCRACRASRTSASRGPGSARWGSRRSGSPWAERD